MRDRDPRILLLAFSFLPFAFWIGGPLLIWRFWPESWGLILGFAAVWCGFGVVKSQDLVIAFIYSTYLRRALAACASSQWIPVAMEKTGTQDKFHVLPDNVGIMQRTADGLVLRDLHGMVYHLSNAEILTANLSKTKMSCSILFTDRHNNDLVGFVVSPRCIGASLEVAADGNSRYQWFLKWADLPNADASPAE